MMKVIICTKFGPPELLQLAEVAKPASKINEVLIRIYAATGLSSAAKKIIDLAYINKIIETGKYIPVIDKVYPLEEIVEAHKYVEKGHKKGDVEIRISQNKKL